MTALASWCLKKSSFVVWVVLLIVVLVNVIGHSSGSHKLLLWTITKQAVKSGVITDPRVIMTPPGSSAILQNSAEGLHHASTEAGIASAPHQTQFTTTSKAAQQEQQPTLQITTNDSVVESIPSLSPPLNLPSEAVQEKNHTRTMLRYDTSSQHHQHLHHFGNTTESSKGTPTSPPSRAGENVTKGKRLTSTNRSNGKQEGCVPRPVHIQAELDAATSNATPPLILYYNDIYGTPLERFIVRKDSATCYTCRSTSNQSLIMEADVVAFHYFSAQRKPLPPKYCGQLWLLMSRENPNYLHPKLNSNLQQKYDAMKQFDLTATYRLDADLPIPYLAERGARNVQNMFLKPPPMVPTVQRNSTFPVVWIASKCTTHNDRIDYVRQLLQQNNIGVQSFGACLHTSDMDVPRKSSNWSRAADHQVRTHKFYLALENSDCPYYSTEKLFRAYETGLIPIILGSRETAPLFVPNQHSAIYMQDYNTMKDLADRLQEINEDDALFESYLSYRGNLSEIDESFQKRWFEPTTPRACRLCDLVRQYKNQSLRQEDFVGVRLEHLYCNNSNPNA